VVQRPNQTAAGPVLRAVAATTVGVCPVFLTGGMAVQIRADLGFSIAALGLATSVFFALSALSSAPLGRAVDRVGSRLAMRVAALLSAGSLAGVALLARDWRALVGALAVAGVANSMAQLAANRLVAGAVPVGHQGLAFGAKQAAIPTATLLAGLAAPLVALTVGWRVAFAGAAVAAAVVAVVVPKRARPAEPVEGPIRAGAERTAPGTLLVLAVGMTLGSAAAVPLGSFLVEGAVAVGIAPGRAGLLLAACSLVGIGVRLGTGWLVDRRARGTLQAVASLLGLGAGGFVLLALADSAWPLALGAFLALGAGWSWPGLFNFAVVNENRSRPAAATGVTQTGASLGSAVGPLLFGLVVAQNSYSVAWAMSAVLAAVAAAAAMCGRRLILSARADRE
jgi:MFS family permease